MQLLFEEVISSFLEKRVGISNGFLTTDLAYQLKLNLLTHYDNRALKLAGIGNDHRLRQDQEVRKDQIFWLNASDNNPHELAFFELIDAFVLYLNQTCFAGIISHEFHYALYEKGAFYKEHLDQFKTNDHRAFSMIMYLNEGWVITDGGELRIVHQNGVQLISPENRRCVFFKSNELPHEVLVTNVSRMSITGWLKT